jgi:hypothetical protein
MFTARSLANGAIGFKGFETTPQPFCSNTEVGSWNETSRQRRCIFGFPCCASWRRTWPAGSRRPKGLTAGGLGGELPAVRQANDLLNAPGPSTLKGKRDRAILALLIDFGLWRAEVLRLAIDQIQRGALGDPRHARQKKPAAHRGEGADGRVDDGGRSLPGAALPAGQ